MAAALRRFNPRAAIRLCSRRPAVTWREFAVDVNASGRRRGLLERLADGEYILCAEGYLLHLARMGYIAHGVWVPEFLLEQPEVLRGVHYEYVHAGSDVTEAFQYYTHREKMRQIGREDDLEPINRVALRIAGEVARETDTLFAGGISNTNIFVPRDPSASQRVEEMFKEQVQWAQEEGADYIIAETFSHLGEAEIALDVIKSAGLPAVVTFSVPMRPNADGTHSTLDGVPLATACRKLVEGGATIVGTNCCRGPGTMLTLVEEIVREVAPEKVGALPIAYRTTDEEPSFFDLTDKCCPENNPVYPRGLDAFHVSTMEIFRFTKRCMELGLRYIGICCGNTGNYTRAMAEAMGRQPPASKYIDPTNFGINPLQRKKELERRQ